MKYSIHINQIRSIEWGLSTSEAVVFSWIYELASWAEKLIYNENTFYFSSRIKACEELPIVTEKTDTMYRHFKSLEKKGLVSLLVINKKDYIALTEKGKQWYYENELPNDGKKSEETRKNFRENSEKNPTYKYISNKEINNNIPLPPKGKKDIKKEILIGDYVSPEYKEVFTDWLEYKKQRKEAYKTEKSIQLCYNKLIKLSGNNPDTARQIVDQSMANNWAGLFELKNEGYGNNRTKNSRKQEANNYALRQYIEEGERIARGERVYTTDPENRPF